MTDTTDWPFGTDADRDDPLTTHRIAVTSSHPQWFYLVAFHRDSEARPTETETTMLASYLEEYKAHWYNLSYLNKLAQRPLDVDGGANGVIFCKHAENDWGYRRQSWIRGPLFVPQPPKLQKRYPNDVQLGPMTLEQVMDHAHTIVDEVSKRWLEWKAQHPDVFAPAQSDS